MTSTPAARPRRRDVALGLSIVAALAITACGGDDDEGSATTAAAREPTADEGGGSTTVAPVTAATDTVATASTAPATTGTAGSPSTSPATTGGGATGDIDAYIERGAAEFEFGNEEERRCMSAAIIDAIGADNVLATGLSPDEFIGSESIEATGVEVTEQMRTDVQAGMLECGDLLEIVAPFAGGEQPEACLREFYTSALIAEQLAVSLFGAEPSPELADAQTAANACALE